MYTLKHLSANHNRQRCEAKGSQQRQIFSFGGALGRAWGWPMPLLRDLPKDLPKDLFRSIRLFAVTHALVLLAFVTVASVADLRQIRENTFAEAARLGGGFVADEARWHVGPQMLPVLLPPPRHVSATDTASGSQDASQV